MALEVTRLIQSYYSRSRALRAMAPHLPEALWSEALEVTRQIQDEDYRSRALRAMVPHLPDPLLPKALGIIRAIQDKYYCADALQGFLSYIECLSMPFADCAEVIGILAYQNRKQLLQALPKSKPMLLRLGNDEAFSEILQAVRDVCKQWP